MHVDVTGADTLSELIDELKKEDIETYIARAKLNIMSVFTKDEISDKVKIFKSVRAGVDYYLKNKKD